MGNLLGFLAIPGIVSIVYEETHCFKQGSPCHQIQWVKAFFGSKIQRGIDKETHY